MELAEVWGGKYPVIVRLWENPWAEFVPFLAFDAEIRRVVCSTNATESVNARIRRAVRPAGTSRTTGRPEMRLPRRDGPGPDRHRQRRWTMRWKPALNAFDLAFEGRLTAGRN